MRSFVSAFHRLAADSPIPRSSASTSKKRSALLTTSSQEKISAAALAGRKKLIAIVDDEDKADVVIEVDERTTVVPKIVIGLGPRPGQPSNPAATGPSREVRLRVNATLSHADESREVANKNRANDNPGGWRSAAEDVAKQIEKWLNERRAKILAARPKAPINPKAVSPKAVSPKAVSPKAVSPKV